MKLAPPVAKPLPTPKGKPLRRAPAPVRARVPDEPSQSDVDSSELDSNAHESLARSHNPSLGASSPPSKPTHIASRIVVGAAHDPLEHEADAIADRVMRMSAPHDAATPRTHPAETPWANTLRRACKACCDACEDDDEPLRREPAAGQRGGVASEAFAARLDARTRLGGSPLTPDARAFLEPRLRVGLDRVRTHTDASADSLARNVGARAFTVGQHIFFAAGELRPRASAGMRLLAHEVAHTLQGPGPASLRRTPESEAVDAVDTGDDLLAQSKSIQSAVDSIRRGLHRVLVDLVMPNEEGISGLDDYDLPTRLRDRAKAAVVRYRKVTRYLEARSTLESVLMIQWLDAALEVIALLRQCVKYIAEHDEFVGAVVDADYGKSLRRLSSRAKQLRKHPFFQQGQQIEAELRPLEEAEARADRQAEVTRQLDEVRREMGAYWNWQSRDAIEAEHRRLTTKLLVLGGHSATGVLEAQIEVLAALADPNNYESDGSITDQAQALARIAESDLQRGAAAIAAAIEEGKVKIVIDAFRWLEFEDSATRAERLAPMVLQGFEDPSKALGKLDQTEQGKILIEWLAPPRRPELQFALLVIWADPDGSSARSPEDARAKLLEQSRAARAKSVSTATAMLQSSGRLARYAESAGTRSLLIEMAYQLWLDGFTFGKVPTGDALASTLAPELDADRALVIADGDLSISWTGDDMRVSVDPFFSAKPKPVRVPASASVWLEGSDSPLMPALKLLELEARGDRNALQWAGQGLAHGATEAGASTNQWIESKAKGGLRLANQALDVSIETAREVVIEHVPTEYQDEALAVVSGLESAGEVVLTGATYGVGFGVGLSKGAIDTTTGLVGLAGGGLEAVGEFGSDALEGDVLVDVGVKYRETEHTLLVTVDAVPEIAEAFYEQFQAMEGPDKVFLIGEAAGLIAFEVATTIGSGGATKAGKLSKLDDANALIKAADKLGDASEVASDVARTSRKLGKHAEAVDLGHRHHVDADLLRKVEAELPANTEVWVDKRLGRGDVVVEYDVLNGVIDTRSVRIVIGPDASPRWIVLHGATVVAVRKYSGLQGRIRRLLARLRLVDEMAGSARWEAKREIEKLPALVDDELAKLRTATPGSKEADEIHETLEGLSRQFEDWSRVLDGEVSPGEARGLIAARKPKQNKTALKQAKQAEEQAARQAAQTEREEARALAKTEKKHRSAKPRREATNSDEPSVRMPGEWQPLLGSDSRDVGSIIERAFVNAVKHEDGEVREEIMRALTALDALSRHASRIEMNDGFFALLQTFEHTNIGNLRGLRSELEVAHTIIESGRMAPKTKYHIGARGTDVGPDGKSLSDMSEIDGIWQDVDGTVVVVEAKASVGAFVDTLEDAQQLRGLADWVSQPGRRRVEIRCGDERGLSHFFSERPQNDNAWQQFTRATSRATVQDRFTITLGNLELDYATLVRVRERYLVRRRQKGELHLSHEEFDARYGNVKALLIDLTETPDV